MAAEQDFDGQLRAALRDVLDRQSGPDPVWAESPAAKRIAKLQHRGRFGRWPIRMLAVAALLVVGGGAVILSGVLSRPQPRPSDITNGWIAYTSYDPDASGKSDANIYLVALDQRPRRVIGTDSEQLDQICPAFSADGTRLAYGEAERIGPLGHGAEYRRGALVIADLDAEGNVTRSQTIDIGGSFPPPCASWSPDGRSVAIGVPLTSPINPEESAAGSEVWIVRIVDGQITRLPDLLATDLEWSADGTQLALTSGEDDLVPGDGLRDGLIYLYSISAHELRSLATTHGASSLSWSPDGSRIVYQADDRGSESELRIVEVESEGDGLLVGGSEVDGGFGPVWSPLGDRIVYQRMCQGCREARDVILVGPGTGGNWRAPVANVVSTPLEGKGRTEFWTPDRLTWSPDGKYLLYVGSGPGAGSAVVAVPIDPQLPAVVLAQGDNISGSDGYDAVAPVPIQSWGRQPPG